MRNTLILLLLLGTGCEFAGKALLYLPVKAAEGALLTAFPPSPPSPPRVEAVRMYEGPRRKWNETATLVEFLPEWHVRKRGSLAAT